MMVARRSGYTLIELIVVIAILGIVSAVAVPAMASLTEDGPLDRGAAAAVTLLTRSRATAVARSEPVSVTVDPATGRYWVLAGTLSLDSTLDITPPVKLQATSPRARFLFLPTGAAVSDTLRLHGDEGDRAVLADPWTGTPHVVR